MKHGDTYRAQRDIERHLVTAKKDLDFGIHGYVPKGKKVKVLALKGTSVYIDLGDHRFHHPQSQRHQIVNGTQFRENFRR